MEEHDSIDLRSKAFQDVMGEPPNWLLRWGITAIFVAFFSLFVVGYFLEYPETITASVRLETTNPPREISSPALGQVIVEVPEDTFVVKGTIIGRINNNSGNFNEILALKNEVDPFNPDSKNLPNLAAFVNKDLGLIKPELLEYRNILLGNGVSTDVLSSQSISSFNRNIETINSEIAKLEKVKVANQLEIDKIPQTKNSYKKTYENQHKRIKDKVKRDSLFTGYTKVLYELDNKRNFLESENRRIQNDIDNKKREISDREQEKTNFQSSIAGTQRTKRQNLGVAFSRLKSKLNEWSTNFIIKAPIDGVIVYQGKLKSKEYLVDKGDKIFAIIQQNATDEIEGKLYVSSKESVKISEGKSVKIKFNAYKPSEFGLLNGIVTDKATIPRNGQYLITVALPKGMKTTKQKDIPFEHQMQGEAQIITQNRNFTGLIWDQFIEMLNR